MHAWLTLFTGLGLLAAPAMAAPPEVMGIVKQMKEASEPARPSTRRITFSISAEGETVKWIAQQARKQFPDGRRVVMVMMEPKDIKGTAYMVWEPKEGPTVIWMYSPFIRRVRKILGVEAHEAFLGSDFTYADLGFVRLHPQYKLLGEEQHGGVNAYKIEETNPQDQFFYSRIITWVDASSKLPLERDYYDFSNALWKTQVLKDVTTVDGVPTPLHITMKNGQTGTSTELDVSDVNYDVPIPDTVFKPELLPVVAADPLWQAPASSRQKPN